MIFPNYENSYQFTNFTDDITGIISDISDVAKKEDIQKLENLIANFKLKTEDFYRENRKLNIGVVGQVKAGKSSFLNTLLFGGKEILPKASTPKTATLTKMEYSENNIIHIEYYSMEEWEVLKENAKVEDEDEIYTSAREIVNMVRNNGVKPEQYLEKGTEDIQFDTYEELISHLNDYVGEDGKYTPIVKAVILYLNKEEYKGLSIVDTPGLNDPIASRTLRTKEFMEVCDVVFFLSQAGSFLDKSDWTLLSTQLPQKGVKRLVLIASKYDSGIRDILRTSNPDDIWGEDENTADNIPKACKIIKRKLKKRAREKVKQFVEELEKQGCSQELIQVIQQCSDPLMVSALAYNMTGKKTEEYNSEEQNIYKALELFSADMESDLNLIGNFDDVKELFSKVVEEKEKIFEEKAKSFVPNAVEEARGLLDGYRKKAEQRIQMLEQNDREQILEQKKAMETQMGNIKKDIADVFGEINASLETQKSEGVREMREVSKDYLSIRERTGTTTHTGSYTTGHLWWKKTHTYTYEEHYSYFMAADAVENLRKFALEASNQAEEVFTEALQLKAMKRKLLDVIVNNFNLASETYDSNLFGIMVAETVGAIEFPVIDMDISGAMNGIAGKFTGEITSPGQKTALSTALQNAVSLIYQNLCDKLVDTVKSFKASMKEISKKIEESLLQNIIQEFNSLLEQCDNKEKEIAGYKEYVVRLQSGMEKLK